MKTSKGIRLSLLIPTLNEAENIGFLLPRLTQVVDSLGCGYEIIVREEGI